MRKFRCETYLTELLLTDQSEERERFLVPKPRGVIGGILAKPTDREDVDDGANAHHVRPLERHVLVLHLRRRRRRRFRRVSWWRRRRRRRLRVARKQLVRLGRVGRGWEAEERAVRKPEPEVPLRASESVPPYVRLVVETRGQRLHARRWPVGARSTVETAGLDERLRGVLQGVPSPHPDAAVGALARRNARVNDVREASRRAIRAVIRLLPTNRDLGNLFENVRLKSLNGFFYQLHTLILKYQEGG